MRTLFVALLCVCGIVTGPAALAQQPPGHGHIPTLILDGLNSYKRAGLGEAVRVWLRNSPIPRQQIITEVHLLHQVEDLYGPYEGYDVIAIRDLTPSTRIVYMALSYSSGPLFARFVVYRTGAGWLMTSFLFNTDDTAILPPGY